jgi:hypothetical protein
VRSKWLNRKTDSTSARVGFFAKNLELSRTKSISFLAIGSTVALIKVSVVLQQFYYAGMAINLPSLVWIINAWSLGRKRFVKNEVDS